MRPSRSHHSPIVLISVQCDGGVESSVSRMAVMFVDDVCWSSVGASHMRLLCYLKLYVGAEAAASTVHPTGQMGRVP